MTEIKKTPPCPYCCNASNVSSYVNNKKGEKIEPDSWKKARIYVCTKNSSHTFRTLEVYTTSPFMSIKRSKRKGSVIEEFNIEKLKRSIHLALGPDVPLDLPGSVALDVSIRLKSNNTGDVTIGDSPRGKIFSSEMVAETTMFALKSKGLNLGWIRYALAYNAEKYDSFSDIKRVAELIADLLEKESNEVRKYLDSDAVL